MKEHLPISIIVIGFVALAALYSFVTPLGEGPDEPGHAAYAFFLAREGWLPVQRPDRSQSDVPGEGHQPPLAYALAAPLTAWLPPDERRFDRPGNPRFTWAGGDELNAVAHGSREYWPWRDQVLAWHLMRLESVALGAATVVFTYLAAKTLDFGFWILGFGLEETQSKIQNLKSKMALIAAALVAFNPQFLFVSALVTNDALLVALSAAMLWLVVRRPTTDGRGLGEGVAPRAGRRAMIHAALMGLLLGLALITKQSAIILLPIALLSVLEQSWFAGRARQDDRTQSIVSSCHRVILSQALLCLGVALAVSGWWYARNWRLYGDLFGLAAFQGEFATQPFEPGSLAAWFGALAQLHGSFWARFGWMNVRPPGWAIWAFAALELVGLMGWLWRLRGSRKRIEDSGWKIEDAGASATTRHSLSSILHPRVFAIAGHWALLALPLLAFAWVVSFALAAGLVAWQGRLLFPALPAIAILLAYGLSRLAVGSRQSAVGRIVRVACWLLLTAYCLLAIWLPFGVIRPAYPFHTLPEEVALDRLGAPVYGRMGLRGDPGAELRGWRVVGAARPGKTLELALMWHARGRQNRDWTAFVHLVGADETIVAEDNRSPQDGAFPMTQWIDGDWVEDRHLLALPPDLAPGVYALRVGLFDPGTGRRAGVFSPRGKLLGDYLEIGKIVVQ